MLARRTSELTRRRESKHPSAAPSKLREALPPLASNDLFGTPLFAREVKQIIQQVAETPNRGPDKCDCRPEEVDRLSGGNIGRDVLRYRFPELHEVFG